MNFYQRIHSIQKKKNSLLCIGLDTDATKLPAHLRPSIRSMVEFNKAIIEATKDVASAYKINFAFYEALGADGWKLIEKTRALIPSSILTIADAKRGDIGNTSKQYADAIFKSLDFDSITVAPYMGKDSVQPFLEDSTKGVFLLALTSNSGAFDFQYQHIGKKRLFEVVISASREWTVNGNLGFVVGATKSTDIRVARLLAPDHPFLVPGVGAQGGSVADVIKFGCTKDGFGVIINASRSILYASKGKDFAEVSRSEAIKLNNEINFFREKFY